MIRTRSDIITSLQQKSQDTSSDLPWGDWVNESKDIIESIYPWPFLRRRDFVSTVAPISTGDADVTNADATVSSNHASTSWAASIAGRKFRKASEDAIYDILSRTSSTEFELSKNYTGSTATDAEYSIFQDEYKLPPDMIFPKNIRDHDKPTKLQWVSLGVFDELEPSNRSESPPEFSILLGREDDRYTTGTVTASVNTSVLTGSSTSWSSVEGLGKGSKITIPTSNIVKIVKSVDSDTQITIYGTFSSAIAASTAYIAHLDNYIVQFSDIPDQVLQLPIRYQGFSPPLMNDYDYCIGWPESMVQLIELHVLMNVADHNNNDSQYTRAKERFESGLFRAKRDHGNPTLDQKHVMRSTDEKVLGRGFVKFPGDYPIEYAR